MPSAPTIELSRVGAAVRMAVSGADAGTTNTMFAQPVGAAGWSNEGSVVGDGNVDAVLDGGDWLVYCRSVDALGAAVSEVEFIHVVTDGVAEAYYRVTRIRKLPGENRKELTVERLEKPIFPVV